MKGLSFKWIGIGLLAGLFLIGFNTGSAEAAEFVGDDTYVLASGETVNEDLFIGATTVTIDGDVNGDIFVGGTDITINGAVDGNIYAGADTLTVNGEVSGDLFAGGNRIILNGSVEDMRVGGAEVSVNGTVRDELMVGGGTVMINGRVQDDAYVGTNDMRFGPEASISGTLTYQTPNEIADASRVAERTEYIAPQEFETQQTSPAATFGGWLVGLIMAVLGYMGLAWLMNRFFPAALNRPADMLETKLGNSLGWGVVLIILAPFFLIFAAIITGLFFGFGSAFAVASIGFSALGLLSLVSPLFVGRWLSSRYLTHEYGLYIAVAALAALISLPIVGGIFGFVIFIAALGSVFLLTRNGGEKAVADVVAEA